MTSSNHTVLVTGGSGFLGIHCIQQLLSKGYQARTTLRALNKKEKVITMLKKGGITDFSNLAFVKADLTSDENWDQAVEGCDYVLHVASPIFLKLPEHEEEMIRPAVDGTIRVLRASRDAGVKRVVMTSNFGAVGYSHKGKGSLITEESWTDPNEKGLSPYNKSKVLAERAAWDFMAKQGGSLELAVINPMAIFGPSFTRDLSSGFELLQKVLDGTMKVLPNISLGIVDVRDVADLHIRAMTSLNANGQRFLALSGGTMTLLEISKFLKSKMPDAAVRASTKTIPDWLVRFTALFSTQAKAIAPLVGIYRNASNEKAKRLLDWNPRSNEEAILATANSLIEFAEEKSNR